MKKGMPGASGASVRRVLKVCGNIVCAKVRLKNDEEEKEFRLRLKRYCSNRLVKNKVPVKIEIVDEKQYGYRFKKIRAHL